MRRTDTYRADAVDSEMTVKDQRIAELEAEVEKLNHFCAKVCEPWQIVEETKAELLIAKRLNAKWMDERTEALIRAEKAEAERVAERENGRTWHREAVVLKTEVARLQRLCQLFAAAGARLMPREKS